MAYTYEWYHFVVSDRRLVWACLGPSGVGKTCWTHHTSFCHRACTIVVELAKARAKASAKARAKPRAKPSAKPRAKAKA